MNLIFLFSKLTRTFSHVPTPSSLWGGSPATKNLFSLLSPSISNTMKEFMTNFVLEFHSLSAVKHQIPKISSHTEIYTQNAVISNHAAHNSSSRLPFWSPHNYLVWLFVCRHDVHSILETSFTGTECSAVFLGLCVLFVTLLWDVLEERGRSLRDEVRRMSR